MLAKLDALLDDFLAKGIPGNDCIVYHKGKCIYRRFKGYSDKQNKIELNGNELYNIYSCSKIITCVAALMLYEKGLFKLEDTLSEYMPEFTEMTIKTNDGIKAAKNSITIKDLFCMTAGFSYNLNSPMLQKCKEETNGSCQTRELMKYLAKEPLLFEPGERWEYSLCHDVLAAFVEVISGIKFGEYVKENIFKPLGMNSTTFLLNEKDIEKVCAQYWYNADTNTNNPCDKTNMYRLGTEYESGGAGCISTVDDYIKFLEGLRAEKLLSKKTIDLMTTNHLSEKQLSSYWVQNAGYGLGVRCSLDHDQITDFGWGGRAGSYPIIDLKNEFTLFYAQHVIDSSIQDYKNRQLSLWAREFCTLNSIQ